VESCVVCGSEGETAGCHDILAGWIGKEPAKPALRTALASPSLLRLVLIILGIYRGVLTSFVSAALRGRTFTNAIGQCPKFFVGKRRVVVWAWTAYTPWLHNFRCDSIRSTACILSRHGHRSETMDADEVLNACAHVIWNVMSPQHV